MIGLLNRRRPRPPVALTPALIAAAVVLGSGLFAASGDARQSHAVAKQSSAVVLKVATFASKAGGKETALVTGSGHVVYLVTGDSRRHPECTSSSCHGFWPPVTSKRKLSLGSGITGKVAIWRHNGISQVTIHGHPLYAFGGDRKADVPGGDGRHNNFGSGTWRTVTPSGAVGK